MNTAFNFLKSIDVYKNEIDEKKSRYVTKECEYLIMVKHAGHVIYIFQTDSIFGCGPTAISQELDYVISTAT